MQYGRKNKNTELPPALKKDEMRNKNASQTIEFGNSLLLKNKNKYNANVVETNNFLVCIWKVILDLQQPVTRVKIAQNKT